MKTEHGIKTHQPVLEDDHLEDVNLCTVGLDQGSIGAAGIAYCQFALFLMVLVSFDKIHRLVRDLKLSLARSACGIFLKAQVYSNNIMVHQLQALWTGTIWDREDPIYESVPVS